MLFDLPAQGCQIDDPDRHPYPTPYPRLPAPGWKAPFYFNIPNALRYIYLMSNLFCINSYDVSNSDPPLPPTPCTKMHAHTAVLQGSAYKLFFEHSYSISTHAI